MEYSHENSWANFEAVFNANLGINEAWNKIIDYHEQLKPQKYWAALRQLELEKEQVEIAQWVEDVVTNSPIPKSVEALWFGITKIWDEENAKEFYAIYLQGADKYDSEDIDWVLESSYEPEENFGIVEGLNQIDELIRDDSDDYAFLDWILPLAYCALTLDEIIRTNKMNRELFLKAKKKMFVTTGFDDGDFVNLTAIE